jgi:two-component system, LytTR family, response regulator
LRGRLVVYSRLAIIGLRHHQAQGSDLAEALQLKTRAILERDDFVLLTDDVECWIVRIGDISTLEARRDQTLIRFAANQVLIRRPLEHYEGRLDSSLFFRASRACMVNLSHLRRPRLENGCLIFQVTDGREIVFSRRQTVHFRATRSL